MAALVLVAGFGIAGPVRNDAGDDCGTAAFTTAPEHIDSQGGQEACDDLIDERRIVLLIVAAAAGALWLGSTRVARSHSEAPR